MVSYKPRASSPNDHAESDNQHLSNCTRNIIKLALFNEICCDKHKSDLLIRVSHLPEDLKENMSGLLDLGGVRGRKTPLPL